jgi:hypothetical protein
VPDPAGVDVAFTCSYLPRFNDATVIAAWAPSTVYAAGAWVKNGKNVYICTAPGTSAAVGGPTGDDRRVPNLDGTVTWQFGSKTGTILHGLLCFSDKGCATCAWDQNEPTGDTTSTTKLFASLSLQKKDSPGNTSVCAGCHGPGPILPKKEIQQDAKKSLQPLNLECSGNGGPKWLCFDATPDWPAPAAATVVAAPKGCGGGECHDNGFMPKGSNSNYCALIRFAFNDPGGSMAPKAVPAGFFASMGVLPKGAACTKDADCCSRTCDGTKLCK